MEKTLCSNSVPHSSQQNLMDMFESANPPAKTLSPPLKVTLLGRDGVPVARGYVMTTTRRENGGQFCGYASLVDALFHGYNATVLAYGQGTTIRVELGDATTTAEPSGAHNISQAFPHTNGQPLDHFLRATSQVPDAQIITEHPAIRVGVVFCGRQSPGGHNVIFKGSFAESERALIRLEQDIEKFIHDPAQQQLFQQLPTSYLRLAAHRVSQHYCLQSM
ncbi:hypothetical protein IFM89_021147, partial [Coptis chinensis]